MPTNSISESGGRVWLENGIIYTEFYNQFALDTIFEVEEQALELIRTNKIALAPNIVLLEKVPAEGIKLSLGAFAQIFTSFEVIKHISAILVVKPNDQAKSALMSINKFFLGGHIQFFDNLADAQKVAESSKNLAEAVLEQKR